MRFVYFLVIVFQGMVHSFGSSVEKHDDCQHNILSAVVHAELYHV
jgi:hypothetical protein